MAAETVARGTARGAASFVAESFSRVRAAGTVLAAEAGGAAGIRAQSTDDIAAIRAVTRLPLLGLWKVTGADVVAAVHDAGALVLADCGSAGDALAAVDAGADAVATTLAGYTGERPRTGGPDLDLAAQMVAQVDVPVLVEGRVHTPNQARVALDTGAWAVVVGTAITHPTSITGLVRRSPDLRIPGPRRAGADVTAETTTGSVQDAGRLMAAEIREQPEALQRLLDHGLPGVRDVAAAIGRYRPRFVLLAARGTSDNAALYAKYLTEVRLGLPAGLASPSTHTIYDATADLRDVLWLAVSQSGGSPDLVESTKAARAAGALTLAVTNQPDSPLGRSAEHTLDVLAGPERAVAATKTYTSQLLALWLLVDALAGGDGRRAHAVPELVSSVTTDADRTVTEAATRLLTDAGRVVVVGRGYAYATAREAALKLMETSYIPAQPFSGADLLHGPTAMLDLSCPVLAVVPDGPAGQALHAVTLAVGERGAPLIAAGSREALAALPAPAAAHLPLPSGVPGDLAPLIQVVPLQQLALDVALARGHDPDRPRGLTKVTRTR